MNQGDFGALCKILQDNETMHAYEGTFSNEEAQEWLDRQIFRYRKRGIGLWAVVFLTGCSGTGDTNTASRYVAVRQWETAHL